MLGKQEITMMNQGDPPGDRKSFAVRPMSWKDRSSLIVATYLLVAVGGRLPGESSEDAMYVLGSLIAHAMITAQFVAAPLLLASLVGWLIPRPPPVEVDATHMRMRWSRWSRRTIDVPLDRIWALHAVRGVPGLVVAVEGRLPRMLHRSDFVDPDAPTAIESALRRSIAALPQGAARMDALNVRAEVARRVFGSVPWATLVLAGTLIGVHAGRVHLFPPGPIGALEAGAANPSLVWSGEIWRLVTANLLHGDLGHLASNVFQILVVGTLLENLVGPRRLVLVFCAAGLCTVGAGVWGGSHLVAVGASGAGLGLTFVLASWFATGGPTSPVNRASGLLFALMCVGPQVLRLLTPNTSWHVEGGHMAGAVGGLVAHLATSVGVTAGDLRRPTKPFMVAFVVLGTTWLGGLAVGAAHLIVDDGSVWERRLALILEEAQADRVRVEGAARLIATSPHATEHLLRAARKARRSWWRDETLPPPAVLDVDATLSWRLGDLDEAISTERRAVAASPTPTLAARLARFEWARHERQGGAWVIGPPLPEVLIAIDAARAGEPGTRVLTVRTPTPILPGSVLHFVGRRDGQLVLMGWVTWGDQNEVRMPSRAHTLDHWPDDASFHVTLTDTLTNAHGVWETYAAWRTLPADELVGPR